MHKFVKWLLLITLLVSGGLFATTTTASAKASKGLILDDARQFYSVASLKRFINEVHRGGGTFLQLHLTDDQRFGVESELLGQTVATARKEGNTYFNPQTGLAFLSKQQLRQLVVYGHDRHVEVIPEIDTPGHSRALIKLMKTASSANRQLAKTITAGNTELDLREPQTKPFVKALLSEYVGLLYRGQHLAIGGDEYSSDTQATQPSVVSYTNYLNRYLNQQGLKTTMWNDGLMKADLKKLDHNIRITYWSFDGQTDSPTVKAQHRRVRASLPALNAAGFKTINANFAYLYVITEPNTFTKHNVAYWQKDLKENWRLNIWDNFNHRSLAKSKNNVGSAISIWGTEKRRYSQAQVLQKTKPFLTTYFQHK